MTARKKCWIAGVFVVCALLAGCVPERLHKASVVQEFRQQPRSAGEEKSLELPYVIRSASLVVLEFGSYEGPSEHRFEQVQDVAALLVSNPRNRPVEYAEISLQQGERTLHFVIRHLPGAARILVIERDEQPFSDAPITACSCTELVEAQEEALIEIVPGDGFLVLINNGENTCSARVFYKSYYADGNYLLGGQSRSILVTALAPGESRRVEVADFSAELSCVVAVQTE